MKLSTSVKEFKTKGTESTLQYVVASSPHMMEILSNSLYSNKIQAIIRELSTNAFESHLRANHNKPFDIALPTYSDKKFRIRDYGTGLSLTELKDLYRIYGVSDKGDSNEYTGCFGLGSKSPFAYTDSFTTISYHKGTKHIIENTKDKSGCPSLVVMGSYDTDEPDGMEIFFNAENEDYYDFKREAQRVYQWFKVRPNVKGPALEYNEYEYDIEESNWKFSAGRGTTYIVMGQVRYPVEDMSPNFINNGMLTIFAEIGDVDISASREKLQYTKRTEAYINNIYKEVESYLEKLINDELSSCKNSYDARMVKWELSKGKYRHFTILKNIQYKGDMVKEMVELTTPILESIRAFNAQVKRLKETKTIYVQANQVYVIKDVKTGHIADAKYLGDKANGEGYDKIFVIEPSNVKEFCEKMGFDESYLIKCSEVGRPKSISVANKTEISTAYKFNPNASVHRWRTDSCRVCWDAIAVDLNKETGVHVPIKAWEPCDYSIQNVKDLFKNLPNEDKPDNVLGVLTMRKGKFARHDNWESVSEFITRIKKKYEKYFEDYKNYDIRKELGYLTEISKKSEKLNQLLPKKSDLPLTTASMCAKLYMLGQLNYETHKETEKIRDKIFAKYPLLKDLEDAPIQSIDEMVIYINAKG